MVRISHVLCPVDLSDISQHAVAHAAAMAARYEARLTLLYVFVNLPTLDLPALVLDTADREKLTASMAEMARHAAAASADLVVAEAGYADQEILRQAGDRRADLLVLGTHGRSGFQRLFLGSVTEKVIRQASCPTLVVPPRAADVPPGAPVQVRRILCPVDFSDASLCAVAHALDLAKGNAASLTLLHVVETPVPMGEAVTPFEADLARVREAAAADARRALHALVPDDARGVCTVESAIVEGGAYREILRQAQDRQVDLIVMGARGRGAIDRLLFGSTTHRVIRGAVSPVLVVGQGQKKGPT